MMLEKFHNFSIVLSAHNCFHWRCLCLKTLACLSFISMAFERDNSYPKGIKFLLLYESNAFNILLWHAFCVVHFFGLSCIFFATKTLVHSYISARCKGICQSQLRSYNERENILWLSHLQEWVSRIKVFFYCFFPCRTILLLLWTVF